MLMGKEGLWKDLCSLFISESSYWVIDGRGSPIYLMSYELSYNFDFLISINWELDKFPSHMSWSDFYDMTWWLLIFHSCESNTKHWLVPEVNSPIPKLCATIDKGIRGEYLNP